MLSAGQPNRLPELIQYILLLAALLCGCSSYAELNGGTYKEINSGASDRVFFRDGIVAEGLVFTEVLEAEWIGRIMFRTSKGERRFFDAPAIDRIHITH